MKHTKNRNTKIQNKNIKKATFLILEKLLFWYKENI